MLPLSERPITMGNSFSSLMTMMASLLATPCSTVRRRGWKMELKTLRT